MCIFESIKTIIFTKTVFSTKTVFFNLKYINFNILAIYSIYYVFILKLLFSKIGHVFKLLKLYFLKINLLKPCVRIYYMYMYFLEINFCIYLY